MCKETTCCLLLVLHFVLSHIFNSSYGRDLNPDFRVKAVNLGGWLLTEGWIKPSLFDGIPNKDFLDGTGLQFKSVTMGKYLCAELGGGTIIVAKRIDATGWETFKVKTEELVAADNEGNGGWGDDDPSVFILQTSGKFEGEFQITNGYGPVMAPKVMREHWSTFIVEEDFKFIASNGLNAVRIPVGWWIASDPTIPKPNVGGSLQVLDNAFLWARKYKLKVIIDLHAAHGSQNPNEHSANRDGTIEWGKTDDTIQQTVAVIDFLKARYNAVRKHSPTAYVVMSNRLGPADPTELLSFASGLKGPVIDVHQYSLFSDMFNNMSVQQNLDYVNTNRSAQLNTITQSNGPLTFVASRCRFCDIRLARECRIRDPDIAYAIPPVGNLIA
ncbi:hypothetical protein BC332_14868 [Capsicum chinense]|nr:hypothetical protein BC332_14868 [Capsicum chinense]